MVKNAVLADKNSGLCNIFKFLNLLKHESNKINSSIDNATAF